MAIYEYDEITELIIEDKNFMLDDFENKEKYAITDAIAKGGGHLHGKPDYVILNAYAEKRPKDYYIILRIRTFNENCKIISNLQFYDLIRKSKKLKASADILALRKIDEILQGKGEPDTAEIEEFVDVEKGRLRKYSGTAKKIVVTKDVKTIGAEAFRPNETLEHVILPDTVTEIKRGGFSDCYALKEIELSKRLSIIGNDVFLNCIKLQIIDLPEGLKTIGEYAFAGCKELTSISVPDTVTVINRWAFSGCQHLTAIKLSNKLTCISVGMFGGCVSIKELVIPETVTELLWNAFYGCTSLEKITFSNSIKKICNNTFDGCSSLERLDLPEQLETIEDMALYGCENLKYITLPYGLVNFGKAVFSYCRDITVVSSNFDHFVHMMGEKKVRSMIESIRVNYNVIPQTDKEKFAKCIWGHRTEYLSYAFEKDVVEVLQLLDEFKKITPKTIDVEYIKPAQKAKAKQCLVYLRDWKKKHVPAGKSSK